MARAATVSMVPAGEAPATTGVAVDKTVTVTVENEETRAQSREAAALVATAQAFVIVNDESRREAIAFARAIAARKKSIAGVYTPMKRIIDNAKKDVLKEERDRLAPCEQADVIIRGKLTVYDESVAAEARRLAAAEAARIEAERASNIAALEDDALMAGAFGNADAVDHAHTMIAIEREMPAAVVVDTEPEKVDGFNYTEKTCVACDDLRELVLAIARKVVYLEVAEGLKVAGRADAAKDVLVIAADLPIVPVQMVEYAATFHRSQAVRMGADAAYPGTRVWKEKGTRVVA